MAVHKKDIMLRYFFVLLITGIVGIAIVVKVCFIMFAERQYWQDVANRFVKEDVSIEPTRGNIISSDGKLMAGSLPEFYILMDFQAEGFLLNDTLLMNHINTICESLHKIFLDRSAAEFKQCILNGRKEKNRRCLIYPRQISYEKYKKVREIPFFGLHKFKNGFYEKSVNRRKKPFGSLAARTFGEVYGDKTNGAKNGIELAFDSLLRGKPGLTRRQKIKNRYLDVEKRPAVDGYDVVTSIDVSMQDICEKALLDKLKELDATEGVVVLMEVKTGNVKAIVNMTKNRNGQYRESRNGAISNMMEPGSIFKTASIMVALEDGKITLQDGVDTGNGIKMIHGSEMRDHNWQKGGYHYLTVPEILAMSSNIGVSTLIEKHYGNNPDKFVEGLYRMNLNEPLNLQIPGEGIPNIRRPKDGPWSKTALPWMSIGYETQIPPINLLTFYNAIANNGVMVKPKFVERVTRGGDVIKEYPPEVINPAICSSETLTKIRNILQMAVSQGIGKPAGSEQFNISGKTGTAQISKGSIGYKSDNTVDYLVSFCGYFPSEAPQYSGIVVIQKLGAPASGGLMAGSVFGKIAERIYAKNLVLNIKSAIDTGSIIIPKVTRGEMTEAKTVLDGLKIKSKTKFSAGTKEEIWGRATDGSEEVTLEEQASFLRDFMPDIIGMGAKDIVYLLESKGLKVSLIGVGKACKQSIPEGALIKRGQSVTVQLK
ncbi:Stage V sporulation protein D [termite gut metagenome]|uniref:Stage V sporulation protein D n=1 Tax=termite gut metagenome TaxID=433724 RepID=A0A5J4SWS5_9ZZZZ